MTSTIGQISENYQAVVQQIADAAKSAGRKPEEVTIVGVSKYVDAETTKMLVQAGCKVLGESRPQLLWEKAEKLQDIECQWHMIGHMQRNKLRRTLPIISLIHSVDSMRLAEAISETAQDLELSIQGLLEVNVSEDANKHGFGVDQIEQFLEPISQLPSLEIIGLMAMSGLESTADEARREFSILRELRERLVQRGLPPRMRMDELSMGMSGDYREAILEGATQVRIGSALFRGLMT